MTAWSIQPEGVSAVLTAVRAESQSLGTAIDWLSPAQADLVSGSAATQALGAFQSGGPTGQYLLAEVAMAASGLIESLVPRFTAISSRIQACGLGAAEATTAYVRGDEEMAANTQAAAVAASSSGDLSFFGAR